MSNKKGGNYVWKKINPKSFSEAVGEEVCENGLQLLAKDLQTIFIFEAKNYVSFCSKLGRRGTYIQTKITMLKPTVSMIYNLSSEENPIEEYVS